MKLFQSIKLAAVFVIMISVVAVDFCPFLDMCTDIEMTELVDVEESEKEEENSEKESEKDKILNGNSTHNDSDAQILRLYVVYMPSTAPTPFLETSSPPPDFL